MLNNNENTEGFKTVSTSCNKFDDAQLYFISEVRTGKASSGQVQLEPSSEAARALWQEQMDTAIAAASGGKHPEPTTACWHSCDAHTAARPSAEPASSAM
eukprot:scaffold220566_cov32-Prasinocladus_malaysianus.AAC.1